MGIVLDKMSNYYTTLNLRLTLGNVLISGKITICPGGMIKSYESKLSWDRSCFMLPLLTVLFSSVFFDENVSGTSAALTQQMALFNNTLAKVIAPFLCKSFTTQILKLLINDSCLNSLNGPLCCFNSHVESCHVYWLTHYISVEMLNGFWVTLAVYNVCWAHL